MLIKTKFLPCTNTKGARIKAEFMDFRGGSVTIGYPYEFSGSKAHAIAAKELIGKFGIDSGSWQVEAVLDGYIFARFSSYDNLTF